MKRLFLLLFFSYSALACQEGHYRLYDKAELLLNNHPDSALAILSSISPSEVKKGQDRARYYLLLAESLDKLYIDTTDLNIIQYSVDYYSTHNDKGSLFKALYYQGRIYQNANRYNDAILSFTKAERILDEKSDPNYHLLLYSAMSGVFHNCFNRKTALDYTCKAMDVVDNFHLEKYRNNTTYMMALELSNNKQYQQALTIYDSLCCSNIKDTVLLQRIYRDYAFARATSDQHDYLYIKKLYDNAQDLNAYFQIDDYCAYAYVLGMMGDIRESDELFRGVEALGTKESSIAAMWRYPLEAKHGDYKKAYKYLEQALNYQNHVAGEQLEQSLFQTQKDYLTSKLNESNLEIRNEHIKNNLLLTILCFCSILAGGIILYITKRNQRLAAEKVIAHEALFRKLKADYTKCLFRPFGQLLADYSFAISLGISEKDATAKLVEKLKSVIQDGSWFDEEINKATDGALTSFYRDYPTMSAINKLLFKLYAAGFDATIISILTDIGTQNAVYIRKNRLKGIIAKSNTPDKERYIELLS